jgi:uncharacterized DUF497 family protein
LAKHGLDFSDLDPNFFVNARVAPSIDGRFVAVGELQSQMMIVTVVFKPLGGEAIAVISMRPASRKERNI